MSIVLLPAGYTAGMDVSTADFGEWLLQQIERREWTQADFARRGQFNAENVSRWIGGKRQPTYQSARKIAKVLSIDEDLVLQQAGLKAPPRATPTPRSFEDILRELEAERPIAVPIVEQVASAGYGEGAIGYVYLPPIGGRRPRLFAMRVDGACMTPRIMPGDTIIVDPEKPPETGKIVVAVAGENWDLVLVKRLVDDHGRRVLQPENPACGRPVVIDDRVRIVGVVIKILRDA